MRSARSPYRPSGRFDPSRVAVVTAMIGLVTVTSGAAYYAAVMVSWYLLALVLAIVVAAVCRFSAWAIRYAHCRNRSLAVALGILSGLGGYLCHFHIDHVIRWGAPVAAIDRLPSYIAFRLATDTWVQGAVLKPLDPAPGVQPAAQWPAGPLGIVNWCVFLFEALTLATAPAAAALVMAGWPYSEQRRRWCSRESLYLTKESGQLLQQALEDGDVAGWATNLLPREYVGRSNVRVTFWYTPCDAAADADTAVFVSIGRGRPVRMELAEAAALVSVLPGLQALAGVSPVSAQPAVPTDLDPLLTHIWPVPPAHAGCIYTPWQRKVRGWRRSLRLLGIPLLGGIFLFGGNIVLLTWFIVPGKLPPWTLPAYIAALGIPLWLYVQFRVVPVDTWMWHFGGTFEMLYETIARRPDPLVRIDDSDAIYVELLPRRQWESGTARPEQSNEGLLRFDWDRRVALFEGENQRIVMPGASILKAHIEILPGVPEGLDPPYGVFLQVRTQAGVWDLPLFPLLGLAGNCGRDRALELWSLFDDLSGGELEDEPSDSPGQVETLARIREDFA